jgi:hypothetical protein
LAVADLRVPVDEGGNVARTQVLTITIIISDVVIAPNDWGMHHLANKELSRHPADDNSTGAFVGGEEPEQ